jgi:hypothetical protein
MVILNEVKNPVDHRRSVLRHLTGSFLLRGGFAGQVATLRMTHGKTEGLKTPLGWTRAAGAIRAPAT